MTDATKRAREIKQLRLDREEALADRRRLEQELGAAISTLEGMRRCQKRNQRVRYGRDVDRA